MVARLTLFAIYISLIPEKRILMVSHSFIYLALMGFPIFKRASNAEMLKIDNAELCKLATAAFDRIRSKELKK